ncbi:thioredoxin family protein [Planotetraspora kaengkrachanensis]|uniref:Thiol reductase thioredoxin n=1 Tax=Planotetraspora kaengkrachanensis TaxID=575193 RepID=A0A8J3PZ38_9ACTN|nr:thioredoxin family protein [Planotetraspora kaengkrachanensis]GIG83730.1 thiol reductase thioredoxin [Planotetraspora kaengkrachanensis]
MAGIVVLGATLVVGAIIGFLMRRRDGKVRAVKQADSGARPVVTSDDLGSPLGERATLVQFSTAFCQPCRATRRVLHDVAEMVPGVRHVEIDAESRLDLVRRFDVMRTPTVLVVDDSGNVVKRASGLPRKADVIAALGAAVDGASHDSSHQSDSV